MMAAVDAHQRLYRDVVLAHARAPRHATPLPPPCLQAEACNALCGDRVAISLLLDAQGRAADVGHASDGCVLCVASASLMCGQVMGRDRAEMLDLHAALQALLHGDRDGDAACDEAMLGELVALAGAASYPSRRTCVLLPWEALLRAWPTQASDA